MIDMNPEKRQIMKEINELSKQNKLANYQASCVPSTDLRVSLEDETMLQNMSQIKGKYSHFFAGNLRMSLEKEREEVQKQLKKRYEIGNSKKIVVNNVLDEYKEGTDKWSSFLRLRSKIKKGKYF